MKAKSILLVDDDPTTRGEVLRQLAGFDVTEAANGLDAVRELHNRHFDCVIVDLTLPIVSAYEVLRRAALDPKTRSVALSAVSQIHLRHFEGSLAHSVVRKANKEGRLAAILDAVA